MPLRKHKKINRVTGQMKTFEEYGWPTGTDNGYTAKNSITGEYITLDAEGQITAMVLTRTCYADAMEIASLYAKKIKMLRENS